MASSAARPAPPAPVRPVPAPDPAPMVAQAPPAEERIAEFRSNSRISALGEQRLLTLDRAFTLDVSIDDTDVAGCAGQGDEDEDEAGEHDPGFEDDSKIFHGFLRLGVMAMTPIVTVPAVTVRRVPTSTVEPRGT